MTFWETVRNIGSLLGILVVCGGFMLWMFSMSTQVNANSQLLGEIKEIVLTNGRH